MPRTTVNIDDALLEEAQRLTGITDHTVLIHAGLKALIERECSRQLSRLNSSHPGLADILRRRAASP
jgi:Arc/MetJ family transcription regulator